MAGVNTTIASAALKWGGNRRFAVVPQAEVCAPGGAW